MSEPIRIALVAEGPTDRIVVEATVRSMLGDRSFVLQQLQPESSVAFGDLGTGWCGVYRWCRQAARRGNGSVSGDGLLFAQYDVLVVHLDADVAAKSYEDCTISPEAGDRALPCVMTCPPASDTVNGLRSVVLSWCGEPSAPARMVMCVPSKSTEAWVLASLFPADAAVGPGLECFANPESRLGQQPAHRRIKKRQRDYQDRSDDFSSAWPEVAKLGEAARFQAEFLAAVP